MNRAYAILLCGVFVLSFFKGFRLPSTWSATHFAFNWSQGFMRRALVGELARRIGGNDVYTYRVFTVLSLLSLGAVVALFALTANHALRVWRGDWTLRVALLVVSASPALVFLIHLIGYFDYFGLLALLGLLLWLRKPRHRYMVFFAVAFGGAVLGLVHEGLLVMFAPTALFLALCNWLRQQGERALSAREWGLLGVHFVGTIAALASFVLIVTHASNAERSSALQAFARLHADFPIRSDAFDVLDTPLRKNVFEVVPAFWRLEHERHKACQGALGFVPGFAFSLFCGWRELAARERGSPLRLLLMLCFFGASMAPQLMNFAGWDWPRWNSMALIDCMICLLAYACIFPNAKRAPSAVPLLTAGLLLTAVGLASTAFLFDNFEVQFFPFERQAKVIERALGGHLGQGAHP